MIDPVEVFGKGTLLLPTSSSSSEHTVSPVPTVMPTMPEYQDASDTGVKTLW